jgi:hypothetical protein
MVKRPIILKKLWSTFGIYNYLISPYHLIDMPVELNKGESDCGAGKLSAGRLTHDLVFIRLTFVFKLFNKTENFAVSWFSYDVVSEILPSIS